MFNDTYSTDVVRFEIGTDIAMCGEDIGKEISLYREDLAEKTGFIFPLVHIVENFSIQENQIKIFVQEKEINEERVKQGKKEFEYTDEIEEKEIKVSETDKESGYYHRDNKEKGFMYLDHRTVDSKCNILVD